MNRARIVVVLTYVLAFLVALAVGDASKTQAPLAVAFEAALAATAVVFCFSLAFRNSSLFDAYWSLAPMAIAVYWAQRPEIVGVNPIRLGLVLALILLWGVRLTWNWLRRWQGLGDEDWRCVEIARRAGAFRWPVSFLAVHMGPTLVLLVALLPVYVVMAVGREPVGYFDFFAFAVTLGAILLEARADKELARYREVSSSPGDFLNRGLWAWSRHPNYLGEILFWWGLWLFAFAANPGWWWTIVGPLSITALFRWASLPWIEAHMRERRPGYAAWADRSSLLFPRRPAAGS